MRFDVVLLCLLVWMAVMLGVHAKERMAEPSANRLVTWLMFALSVALLLGSPFASVWWRL